jgi:8-oxo-dGTP pyrophosphatase MutT (NUDIX family)
LRFRLSHGKNIPFSMPHRAFLTGQLEALPVRLTPEEEAFRQRMLELVRTRPDCFLRSCFPGHFTGSAFITSHDGARTLLIHHRFLDRWLQPGGHCDGEGDVAAVALREALEETGVAGLVLAQPEPIDLDIHAIPANAKKGEPPHEHFDLRYLVIAPPDAVLMRNEETNDARWFTWEETLGLDLDAGLRRLAGQARMLREKTA